MPLSMFESMRGDLREPSGAVHFAEVALAAESNHVPHLLATGLLRLSGVARLDPWWDDVPIEGTLELAFTRRRLAYDLEFRDAEGCRWTLVGRKRLSLRHPLIGATTLYTTLAKDGVAVAEGILRFDLNDLPAFVASAAPLGATARADLGAEPLGPAEAEAFRALGRALLGTAGDPASQGGAGEPTADDVVDLAEQVRRALPPDLRWMNRAALKAVGALARLSTGRALKTLPGARTEQVLKWLDRTAAGSGLDLVLGVPWRSAAASTDGYRARIGMPDFRNSAAEPPPPWRRRLVAPEDLETETSLDADVVVIGTGAGGGAVAAALAERGLAVAILEEGRLATREDFSGDPRQRMGRFYHQAGMATTLGNPPISIPTGRMVGGSTAINSGTCFRTPDAVLARWRGELGFPDEFQGQGFGHYLDAVWNELQVGAPDPATLGAIAQAVARGADALGGSHHPLQRNAPGCDGQGLCAFGCPTGAKRSSDVSWIPRALNAGAWLYTGLPVERVHLRGGTAVAVEARGSDHHGAARRLLVRARAVVLAAGTYRTPLLLHRSGIRHLPGLGRNLSIHPALGMFARFDERIDPWHAVPQGYGVKGLVDDRVRFEGMWIPPQVGAVAIPLRGAELRRWLDAQACVGQYGFMVTDDPSGRVLPTPWGQPLVRYDLKRDLLPVFRGAVSALAEMLLIGGAREVLTAVRTHPVVRSLDEARALKEARIDATDLRLAAFHPLGTCRMGRSPRDSVVDFDHRVWDTRNLYVADGSAVPTSLGVNPQVTIMAMALRAADRVAAALG